MIARSMKAQTKQAASDSLSTGVRVLRDEAEALRLLAGTLGDAFVAAVELVANSQGRIVLTGMGKSGHIGRKIAATLASTGTPALFVHPAEASHGDLGMIAANDVVIALSNSGETKELSDIVLHTRRFGIDLVAITRAPQSSLAKNADIALVLPAVPEVCPMGLSPTTSTTMSLALGDALAVAVLERKGFTADDFRGFHPGGKLGTLLQRVSDLMHKAEALPLVPQEVEMPDALMVMSDKAFGCVGVVDTAQGKLVGIFTDGDLRRHIGDKLLLQTIGEVMTRNPMVITADALAVEAVKLLNEKKRTQIFVVDADHRPIGLLHIHDLLRAGVV
jgi:arabinose-5-phosphate isomerase